MENRIVTVRPSRGNSFKFVTNASNWGELRRLLEVGVNDIDGNVQTLELSNMKVIESVNKTTLEHKDAALPSTDFTLFMMQAQSKGASLRSDFAKEFLALAIRNAVNLLGLDDTKNLVGDMLEEIEDTEDGDEDDIWSGILN